MTVTGTFLNANDTPRASTEIRFIPEDNPQADASGVLTAPHIVVVTDVNGVMPSTTLELGRYIVQVGRNKRDFFKISVPDSAATADVKTLMDAGTFPGAPSRLEYFLEATTTNNTQTELLVEGSTTRMVIPTNTAWAFEILLLSFSGGPAGSFAGAWRLTGAIQNSNGTVSLTKNWDATNPSYSTFGTFNPALASGNAGTTTVLAGDTSNTFGAPVADADDTNKALRLKVTAANYPASTFKWAARVRLEQITYTQP